jgi:polyphosphate kinase
MPNPEDDALELDGKLKRKEYERELARLHVEFVKLQQWVVQKGLKVCIVFEGRGRS